MNGVEVIQKYLEICGMFDDFSGMVFGEEAWVGNVWRNTLTGNFFDLLECIRESTSKVDYKALRKHCTT